MLRILNVAICKLLTRFFYGGAIILITSFGVNAHEFWIEPQDTQVEVGQQIVGKLKVGQDLKGNSYSFLPQRFESFTVTVDGKTVPVEGRLGDNPALALEARASGLHIFAYQSNPEMLTYTDASKFKSFLSYEGLDWVLEAHAQRGLPPVKFKESYVRYAKSLVHVGPASANTMQNDQAVGLPIELIAMQSPFEPGLNSIQVKLLREGVPLAGIQVATFQRDVDGTFARRLARSNSDGLAEVSLDGNGLFLISAVQMEEANPADYDEDVVGRKPVWKSLWASLSFRLEE